MTCIAISYSVRLSSHFSLINVCTGSVGFPEATTMKMKRRVLCVATILTLLHRANAISSSNSTQGIYLCHVAVHTSTCCILHSTFSQGN